MEAVRILMENYWIRKAKDKELYGKTKRALGKSRRFFTEQLGWNLIDNERILKLEKLPAHAESYMGITDFAEIQDYCIFCALLIFLEDKEDGEQFLLSELTAMVEAQLQDVMEIDWTMFRQRKSLVRVLKFAEAMGFLDVYDGSSESVSGGIDHEVLYENTGLSRYFATNFGYSISDFSGYRDFEEVPVKELDADRGRFRINRVYRQLAAAPALYWESSEDPDSLYLKNQRQWIGKYLDENLGGSLHVHKNAAFFVLDETDHFGEVHPREAAVSEVTLNLCARIRELADAGKLVRENGDCIRISEGEFGEVLAGCQKQYRAAWSKEFREMPFEKLKETILDYMESWMLLSREDDKTIVLRPGAAKITGVYPKEFLKKVAAEDEQE